MNTHSKAQSYYEEGEGWLQRQQVHRAAQAFSKSLQLNADHLNAAIRLGNYLLMENNPKAALKVFTLGLEGNPANLTLTKGKLFALKDMRRTEAANELISTLSDSSDLFLLRGQLLLQEEKYDAARTAFRLGISHPATAVASFRNILQAAHLGGGGRALQTEFETLMADAPDFGIGYLIGADIFKEIGDFEQAQNCLDRYETSFPAHPETDQIRASIYLELGEGEAAYRCASNAIAMNPDNPVSAMRLAQAALMVGRFSESLNLAEKSMSQQGHNAFWPAIKATALKALGRDKDYQNFLGMPNAIGVYDLQDVEGYDSPADFLKRLKETLLKLHNWNAQPLSQSVRGGTQTSWDLRFSENAVIQAFFAAMRPLIDDYISKMPKQAGHPLHSRKSEDFYFSGGWSVLLKAQGYHVNHIHPDGWLSSAFYVDVPDSVENQQNKSGWLNFGTPPFAVTGLKPNLDIQPVPGRLVLFPSYLWHGTRPILEGETRLTLPFDIKPSYLKLNLS